MTNEKIIIANLKCSGCATTIKNDLLAIKGVAETVVDIEKDTVDITYDGIDRQVIIDKLYSLGYPEAAEKNGLLLQLKSYASCMVGRVNNLKQ